MFNNAPMHNSSTYDDIRPYADHEVQAVIHQLIAKPSFRKLLAYLFPERTYELLIADLKNVKTVHQLQKQLIYKVVRSIVRQSIRELTFTGLDHLDLTQSYLFISNHRDIILDSALLNSLLFEHGYDTAHIAIGDNLLFSNLVSDLMKLNKAFVVQRALGGQEMYEHTRHLSAYIRHVLTELAQPVWIAQRSGRTKDGNDQTQTGLLKMLSISGGKDFVKSFEQLRLVPVAISYEYDPCDILKAVESYTRAQTDNYLKQAGEDKKSMVLGITENKGRVEVAIGKPIMDELPSIVSIQNKNERFRQFAMIIDEQIHLNYRLWPTHYIAADLLYDSQNYTAHYTPMEKSSFERYIEDRLAQASIKDELLKGFLLQIYANPVTNKRYHS